jgi:predicted DNA-binding transcriptional regulator YafY
MPKQTSDRYHEFIARLLKQPRNMEDLTQYFEVDRRTIYRWIETVKEKLHVEIINTKGKFDLSNASKDLIKNNSLNNWMFNTFSLMNLLDSREALMDRILLEHIPSSNDEDKLQVILEAMEQNHRIRFEYTKYYNNPEHEPEPYESVEPYCVKLFERRWYVLCHTNKLTNKGMRTFSLDQISNLKMLNSTFKLPKSFNAAKYFDDVYGITTGMNGAFSTIKIKVDAARANYFRALPLHHSQEEEQHEDYSIFTYRLRPANDFYQALLHEGELLEVLEPAEVREAMKEKIGKMAERYKRTAKKKRITNN